MGKGNSYNSPARTVAESYGKGPVAGAGEVTAGQPGVMKSKVNPASSKSSKGGKSQSTNH